MSDWPAPAPGPPLYLRRALAVPVRPSRVAVWLMTCACGWPLGVAHEGQNCIDWLLPHLVREHGYTPAQARALPEDGVMDVTAQQYTFRNRHGEIVAEARSVRVPDPL